MADPRTSLSRRERELMGIAFRVDGGSVSEIRQEMAEPPSYSAVRATLNLLVDKGHLSVDKQGSRHVYTPTASLGRARRGALREVVDTFFQGRPGEAAYALVDGAAGHLDQDELAELHRVIRSRLESR